jgi:hypothetical protein
MLPNNKFPDDSSQEKSVKGQRFRVQRFRVQGSDVPRASAWRIVEKYQKMDPCEEISTGEP